MNATSVSDTDSPLTAHSWAISRIMFFITLSAWARDILWKHTDGNIDESYEHK